MHRAEAQVGQTFEAIRTTPGAPDCLTKVDVSFTSKIEQLEQKYALLQEDHISVVEECERLKAQATGNGQLRASAENELAAKRDDLESAHVVVQDLRRQLQVASEELKELQQQRASTVHEINDISRRLYNVGPGLCTVAEPATV
jgi:chromosome segregation ATPase